MITFAIVLCKVWSYIKIYSSLSNTSKGLDFFGQFRCVFFLHAMKPSYFVGRVVEANFNEFILGVKASSRLSFFIH